MSVAAEFDLELGKFRAKLAQAQNEVRRASGVMKQDTAGIGDKMASGFGSVRNALVGIGAVSFGAMLAREVKSTLSAADDLADLGVKLNEGTEALQRVDFAAKQTGAGGVESLANGLIRLEKNLGNVENTKAREALERYGLTAEKLAAMPIDQKVLALAGAFQTARRDGTGVSDLMDLMGKSAHELIPLLAQSRESLEGLFANASIISDADLNRLADANDQLDAMVNKVKVLFAEGVSKGFLGGKMLFGDDQQKAAMEEAVAGAERKQKRLDQQRAQAAGAREMERAAAAKAAADKQGGLDKDNTAAREKLDAARLAALPPTERLAALERKLGGLFSGALAGTGLEGQGKGGLMALIKGYDSPHGREKQTGLIERLTEAEKLERDIVALKKDQAELAKREMEERLKNMKTTYLSAEENQRLARSGRTGSFQSAVDVTFGRTPTADLLAENRTQSGLLRSIDGKIGKLALTSPTDLYGYP